MTIRRAALYLGGASLLAAWFASAASMSVQRGDGRAPAPPADAGAPVPDVPIVDVEAQLERLQRMSSEPQAPRPRRNPFAFQITEPAPRAAAARRLHAATLPPSPAVPAEPGLTLIGLAGERRGAETIRTAMLETDRGELVMAVAGDTILGRYRLVAVGADAIELVDETTGTTKRMVLK